MDDRQKTTRGSGPAPEGSRHPELLIDWREDIGVGKRLRPEFHLFGRQCQAEPVVAAELDDDLDRQGWSPCPRLHPEPGEERWWVFTQPLRLCGREGGQCAAGVYELSVRSVFYEPGIRRPSCFRGKIFLRVPDAAAEAGPTLELDGTEDALVNVQGLDLRRFAKITLRGKGSAVLNVQDALDFSAPADAAPPPESEPKRYVAGVNLKWDQRLFERAPWCGSPAEPRQAMDKAALVHPDGRRTLLIARDRVLFGRERVDEHGRATCDVVLRLWPLEEHRRTLSRLVSRRHCWIGLQNDGLVVTDHPSACGTYFAGGKIDQRRLAGAADLNVRHVFDIGGVLSLEVALHRDPTWVRDAEHVEMGDCCGEIIERCLARAVGASLRPNAWRLVRENGIDAARIRRLQRLPIANYYDALGSILDRSQLDDVRRASGAIDPVDRLADLEEYVLLFRTATIGTADSAAVQLRDPEVADCHARILHLDGVFWLQQLWGRQTTDPETGQPTIETKTHVDDRQIDPHELVPLSPGKRIRLGQTELKFDEFEQIEV